MTNTGSLAWRHAIEAGLAAAFITLLVALGTFEVIPLENNDGKWLLFSVVATPSVASAFVVTTLLWRIVFKPYSGGFWLGGLIGALAVVLAIFAALLLLPMSVAGSGLIDAMMPDMNEDFFIVAFANAFVGVTVMAIVLAAAPFVIAGVYIPIGALAGAIIRWIQHRPDDRPPRGLDISKRIERT